jgi:hypothetical protein
MEEMKVMKKRFVLIAALVAALAMVLFAACPTSVDAASREGTFAPPPPPVWTDSEGLTEGIAAQGDGKFADGIIDFTAPASKLFIVDLPAKTASDGTKKIKITYVCLLIDGQAQLTLKNGAWGSVATANGTDGCNWYPFLTVNDVATLELSEKWYTNETAKISFQASQDTSLFKIKILEIKME